MAETVKKTKAPAKPRKTAAAKNGAPAESGKAAHVAQMRHPSHEEVAELARRYWAERGYQDGHQEEDWFRAEQELRARAS